MTRYIINWVDTIYGTSVINAKSKKEAKEKANNGEDEGFEQDNCTTNGWKIRSIEKLESFFK